MTPRVARALVVVVGASAALAMASCEHDPCARGLCDPTTVACPSALPDEGSACKLRPGVGSPTCEYGGGESSTTAVCACRTQTDGGAWLYATAGDADACTYSWYHTEGCPKQAPDAGTECSYIGYTCSYYEQNRYAQCYCTQVDGGCTFNWSVTLCPAEPPPDGSPCAHEHIRLGPCTYTTSGASKVIATCEPACPSCTDLAWKHKPE
jgi:hypothetical protein